MDSDPFVQGISLGQLARGKGPFASAYLEAASDGTPRLDQISAHASDLSAEMRARRFPSLGPVLEQHQLVVSHVLVTVEDDIFGVTTFGSRAVPDSPSRSLGLIDSVELLIENLQFAPPRLLAVAGEKDYVDTLDTAVREAFPDIRIDHYPVGDLDRELDDLADRLVRDAAAVAAEDVAHELGAYRAAAAEGLAVEGEEVINALLDGQLSAVLAHDDVDDARFYGADRLVDAVVATAVARGVRLTMIPQVDPRRGPAGGLGGIVKALPLDSIAIAQPQHRIASSGEEPDHPNEVKAPA